MARYDAQVVWQSDGEFESGRYSRLHEWRFDGGTIVPASSSPHTVPLPLSDPRGVDPEEALIAAASSCHMLWFLSLAQNEGLVVESYSDAAQGVLGKNEQGKLAITRVVLRPQIVFSGRQPDAAELDRLHDAAHERCFIANSLRGEVVVEIPKPEL
jgi:organic hydroperoxide reductase OsmC/OhrA